MEKKILKIHSISTCFGFFFLVFFGCFTSAVSKKCIKYSFIYQMCVNTTKLLIYPTMCFHFPPAGLAPDGIMYLSLWEREKNNVPHSTLISVWQLLRKRRPPPYSTCAAAPVIEFPGFSFTSHVREPASHSALDALPLHTGRKTKKLMNVDFILFF